MHVADESILLSPSDLSAYLACEHLTSLELRVARGELQRPDRSDDADLLAEKGIAHEDAYLTGLRAEGLKVAEVRSGGDLEAAAKATAAAMAEGVDVVYQGVLIEGRWRGIADFLIRTPDGTYEALDTKLARSAKPSYILQLCFYNQALARLQGTEPGHIHVLLGSGERESFRPQDFEAYARRIRHRLETFIEQDPPTEPIPCAHCDVCDFLPHCEAWWDQVDHLSRVAGCGRPQIARLGAAGIHTLRELAGADPYDPPPGINRHSFAKLQRQAELQLARCEDGQPRYVVLPVEAERGLALLPDASPGDLFFDIEGHPFWDERGSLEYLWGVLDASRDFTPLWADDHASERKAFEDLVDLIHANLIKHPDMHVYHYASYEVSALRRLAGRYESRENEVDELLRRGVLIDLLKVVRGGLAASVPGYGLKEMEVFLPLTRTAEIRDGGTSVVEYERYVQTRDPAILADIAHYNEEDCIATLQLRDWLLDRRAEALQQFGPFPLPEPKEEAATPEHKAQRALLREQLLAAEDPVLDLAAGFLHYHDRERKPVWWAFFDRLGMEPEELVEDSESIGMLKTVGGPVPEKRSQVYRFAFPAQEHKLSAGHTPLDPATGRSAGTIVELDREGCVLALKRGPSLDSAELPVALLPGSPYRTAAQENALERIARSLLAGDRRYPAVESVLRRHTFGRDVQTTDLEEMVDLLLSLDGAHLVIQGPPGTGKTWTSGRLIARALAAGHRVGVASTSHHAIHKLLEEVEAAGMSVNGLKKASDGNPESFYHGARIKSDTDRITCIEAAMSGGTAWLYAHKDCDSALDYLFIDEAGQVSLADALAMATSARNVVLVGDPQQLAQVLQGTHPDGVDASVLQHLLGEHATIPSDAGLFLEQTFRLHPDVAQYISAEFYEGRVHAAPVCAERTTPLGTGLRYCPVDHEDCRQESRPEADRVAAEIARLSKAGVSLEDVIVLAPYNAQVNLLRERLPEAVRVGTVDKFQGQEALVAFYSMASSSGTEVPRGLEFLLSRNRLNVAISRAQCLAYLVCSPKLLEVDCRTIEQMRLANALCRFVEMADEVPAPP
jgi:uncharacterized protein